LAAARDEPSHVLRRASVGSARRNSGESRGAGRAPGGLTPAAPPGNGTGRALGELTPAELTGTVTGAESGACCAADPACCAAAVVCAMSTNSPANSAVDHINRVAFINIAPVLPAVRVMERRGGR